jgi:hypothetical protein
MCRKIMPNLAGDSSGNTPVGAEEMLLDDTWDDTDMAIRPLVFAVIKYSVNILCWSIVAQGSTVHYVARVWG